MRLLLFLLMTGWLLVLSGQPLRTSQQAVKSSGIQNSEREQPIEPRAERVAGILRELKHNHASGNVPTKAYTVTELELNAYLEAQLRKQGRKGVETFSVRLQEDAFVTSLTIDLDKVEVKDEAVTLNLFQMLLEKPATLEVEGQLVAVNNQATFQVIKAQVNQNPLPKSLVRLILRAVGQEQDPPFDPTQPFDLPYGIKTVKIWPGQVTIQ